MLANWVTKLFLPGGTSERVSEWKDEKGHGKGEGEAPENEQTKENTMTMTKNVAEGRKKVWSKQENEQRKVHVDKWEGGRGEGEAQS